MKNYLVLIIAVIFNCFAIASGQDKCYIVTDPKPGAKAEYALGKLEKVLADKGIPVERVVHPGDADGKWIIVAGLQSPEGVVSQFIKKDKIQIPAAPEALAVWKSNYEKKPVVAICGYDEQGLMYGLLDVASRVEWGKKANPFEYIKEIIEKPALATRAISMYTMNRAYWESRFYNDAYWDSYLDMLSKNRFNSMVIILGYENGGFLAPPYPYFFNLPEYPDVRMIGISPEEQRRNLETLNKLIDKAHNRGIKVSIAIWDHIYRGGVQGSGIPGAENAVNQPTPGLVWGLNGSNLISYTKAALSKLVQLLPELDGIEFRMHSESGLKTGEQEAFWADVFKSMKTAAPGMKFILRAKDMPESVIRSALNEGINFRIETKYWMEQMGLPFHPTHINVQNQRDRRHGYADMLYYPQEYKMYWRLWTGGTIRVLLWGNPDYVRRFTASARLYNGDTYEVTEPLATKMEAQPHDSKPFDLLNPQYTYYKYEFERYWHFFQVFGRLGYNPDQSPDIWQKEFEIRFGKQAGKVIEQALNEASWILPRIVASCYPYGAFPTTRGWAEKQRLGDLPEYAKGGGTDIQQFASFDDEAKLLIEGGETAMLLPSMTSVWFAHTSDNLNKLIKEATTLIGKNGNGNKEYLSTITDLKILSYLALYHSRRIPAAVNYRLFDRTKDITALDKAIEYERSAIEAWKKIVESAGDVYTDNLMMGVRETYFDGLTHRMTGHWKDELGFLEEGLKALEKQRISLSSTGSGINRVQYKPATNADNNYLFRVNLDRVESATPGSSVTIRAKVTGVSGIRWVRLRYRSVNQKLDYSTLQMQPAAEKDVYEATIPAREIDPKFDLMYFIEVMDNEKNGKIFPDFNTETPYVIVKLARKN